MLDTHRAIDFGALEIATQLSSEFDCNHTTASVSRLLIDCNRSLNSAHCFSEFTQKLSNDEKKVLIDQYYLPYRKKTETLIQQHIDLRQQVLHVSCHSFEPVFNGITRNGGICLLYDPKRHGEKEVAREWHRLLIQQMLPYRVRMNYPYRGQSDSHIRSLRKKHTQGDYLGFELEINQNLLVDIESTRHVILVLKKSLEELLQLL
jgi:predicted N-formylglutamate amidohydrolase